MKKEAFYLPALLLGIFLIFISGCSTTPQENCEQDEICAGKTVTACCNDAGCYYEYKGKTYGDDEQSMAELIKDLGCTFSGMASYDTDIQNLILRLESLREIAKPIK